MSNLFALMMVLSAASPLLVGDTPPFKIKTKRDNDRVDVKFVEHKTIFLLHSPMGISSAVIENTDETWPDTVLLRLHLSGLEGFKASNGNTTIEAAVSSQNGQVRTWKDGSKETPLNKESPYWLQVRMIGNDGKQTKTLPIKDGYFEIKLPKKFLEENPKSITLKWIDFYRN